MPVYGTSGSGPEAKAVGTVKVNDEIVLRWPSPADAEEVYALVAANRAHLGRWLSWAQGATLESERTWIEGRLAAQAKGDGTPPLIIYRGTLVGSVGLARIDSLNRSGEIGYWLAEDLQGRGIVTRACRALLDDAFGPLGLHRVVIRAATQNTRSRAIPERLGFVFEGIQRQAGLVNGEFLDLAVYSLLAPEWTRRRSAQPA